MYEKFFGLEDAPFRLTPDPRYLFLSKKHEDALAHLKLGLTESGFVCITGDVGTGKTTVLRHFLASLGPDVSAAYIFNPALNAVELLQTINAEFGLDATSTSKKALTDLLNAHLLRLKQGGRRAVVVIDEAQALDIDVLEQLRLLSNLETPTEKLLRIILVGQPQLRALLQHPELVQLNQRITLRWHIGPLSAAETADYVRHRLSVASLAKARDVFSPRALSLVHRLTGGIPRLINMIAHRALLAAFAAEHARVDVRDVKKAHREVSTVPLPVVRRPSRVVPIALGTAAAAVLLLALGVRELAVPPAPRETVAVAPAPGGASPSAASAIASTSPNPTSGPSLTAAGTPETATPPSNAADADAPPSATAAAPTDPSVGDGPAGNDGAAPTPGTEAPSEPTLANLTAEPAPAAAPMADPTTTTLPSPPPEARLAARDSNATLRGALVATASAWGAEPPSDIERSEADLARFADRRRLEYLPFSGNLAMLRLLDVPAILELRLPNVPDSRFAALVALTTDHATLSIDDQPVAVELAFLERYWYGRAHVFSRDYEGLGPGVLSDRERGVRVMRLQTLLERTGLYDAGETGNYNAATRSAVVAFQRSRFIEPDGAVGRLTRMVLYAAVGGYQRPSLTGARS